MNPNPLLKNGIGVVKPDYGTAEEIDEDAIRRTLDEMFARDVLGLDESILESDGPLEILRMKLPRDPFDSWPQVGVPEQNDVNIGTWLLPLVWERRASFSSHGSA